MQFSRPLISWERFPALFLFGSLLCGALSSMGVFLPMLLAFTHKKRSFIVGSVLLSLFTSLLFLQDTKKLPPSKERIKGYLIPKHLKEIDGKLYLLAHLPFLKTFSEKEYTGLYCLIPLSKQERPNFNQHFIIEGMLKPSSSGNVLQPFSWKAVPYTFSFIENRFILKERCKKFIDNHVKDLEVREYFKSLVTGEISDPFLKEKFKGAGLLHTLAISGFHFSWIIFILSIPLSLFFPKKISLLFLLLCAWLYFFFLGGSASVSRSFLAVTLYLISILLSSNPLPLNALGLSGIVSIVIDPYSLFSISFSLSYLATFVILSLNPWINDLSTIFCLKRCSKKQRLMPLSHKIPYLLLRMFSVGGLYSMALQITLLPIFLYCFPFLPLWGSFYNLFFPLSMIPTLILLIFSFAFPPLWKLNEFFSKPFLETVLYGNGAFPLLLKVFHPSMNVVSVMITFILIFSLKKEEEFFNKKRLLEEL